MKKCLWAESSTDKFGIRGLPESCKKKGCKGYFMEWEPLLECYTESTRRKSIKPIKINKREIRVYL